MIYGGIVKNVTDHTTKPISFCIFQNDNMEVAVYNKGRVIMPGDSLICIDPPWWAFWRPPKAGWVPAYQDVRDVFEIFWARKK